MKVGDLVSLKMKETQPPQIPRIGTVVEVWTTGHTRKITTVDIMWCDDTGVNVRGYSPHLFEVISSI